MKVTVEVRQVLECSRIILKALTSGKFSVAEMVNRKLSLTNLEQKACTGAAY